MSYTPINWQTGQTITAEKLNKMDNGWGVQNTQLFSETVTTVEEEMGNSAELTYSTQIIADSITVVFNGTSYTCPKIEAFDSIFYGGFSESGPNFSVYPFAIQSSQNAGNVLYTETAGTYAVSAYSVGVEVSANFETAVNKSVSPSAIKCIPDVTSIHDVAEKALPFFYEQDGITLHIITQVGSVCDIFPESSSITAGFDRDTGLFYLTEGV